MSRWAVAVACAGLLSSVSIAANQEPPPGTPVGQGLPLNNDVNDGTEITDIGLLQVEIGSQWTRVDSDERSASMPLTARYGAYDWLELSFGADVFTEQSEAGLKAQGMGDLQVGGRLRLFAKGGGLPPVSVVSQLNLPTADAASGLGTGRVDPSLGVLTGRDLPHHSHVDVSYGIVAAGEEDGSGRFAQHAAAVSGSLGILPVWTPILTVSWVSRQDEDTGHAFLLAADSVITASRRIALDFNVQFGLNPEAPRVGIGGGMSFVLGELGVDEGVHARRHRLRVWPHRRRTRSAG